MKKTLFLLPLVLSVAACGGRQQSGANNLDMVALATESPAQGRFDPHPRRIAADFALAHLPDSAGQPRAVSDRRHPNGYWQRIELASDVPSADNHVEIAIQSGKTLYSSNKVPVWKPGEAGIREELTRQFPGMRMEVVANGDYSNRYGRIGVAIGRKGKDLRCIYVWQYIDDARRSFENGRRIPLEGVEAAPATLRIKLCRADATIDDLVHDAREIVVDIPENYGSAQAIAEAPPRPARVAKRRAAERRAAEPRRRPEYAQAAPAEPYVNAQGLRYMAPVAAPPQPIAAQAPHAAIGADLPPEALRGPRQ
ncbi:cellulose biosynthesis protein BcsN [Rhodoblastus acidophilus]|uniref:Cellulose biosynthesis protein BcsN n=1 Tax=Candidatus Rhodoblastus alkanivorans TaxID=2954117 RepID=A0ABS9Z6R6_9HYPH|nr:cellulose biosynthesis protein BcsN [Candidatus Rhodoblastus alkanivorans]MCI4678435.1 cellulose biosynthesis protein BcsN [Candidatus Rhodoblastus alkanivorans]MCI4682892.1 cellulose biosynthesis protein BcsN [Candidatus Rhodoblastus alkanivorans]MDI4640201.1 cellulose biosynthesis protein BcsN [Rhodoblastus acidophilus]